MIRIIRQSYDDARERLMSRFGLDEIQAQAILDMRLKALQGLDREKLEAEHQELLQKIAYFESVLADPALVRQILRDELSEIAAKFGDDRKTEIVDVAGEIDVEDLIKEEDCVFTMTHNGYIKRVPKDTYRAQKRGGRGITGMTTREEDYVEELFVGCTHDTVFFFTTRGRVFSVKGYEIPEGSRQSKGMNIVNILQLDENEKVSAMVCARTNDGTGYLTMCTRNGTVKRTPMSEYGNVRRSGLRAIALDEGDELISVKRTGGEDTLLVGTRKGLAIRFDERDARPMGRVTMGVRGIRLQSGDEVVGMELAREGTTLLTVTEKGFGKRSPLSEYKIQSRGGKGITNYKLSEKTGLVVGIRTVTEEEDLLLISSDGILIRMAASDVSLIGRSTQGVRLMRLSDGVDIVNLATADKEPEAEEAEGESGNK